VLLLGTGVEVSGLTVFRDHISPRTFHYLPGRPAVVVDGERAGLELLRYRGRSQGGFLTLQVDLSRDEDSLEAAAVALAERFGGPVDLVPVLFSAGTVRLTALGVESAPALPADPGATSPTATGLVERVLGVTTPSLLDRARAMFSLELDPEGATLLDAAIRGGETPVIVAYDLAIRGLRPARGVRARVDHAMAYDYLRARVAGGALVFKADIDREAEALAREGCLVIEDVDYQGTDPAIREQRRADIVATLRELTEALFFRPATSPAALGVEATGGSGAIAAAWAAHGRPQAAFVLRALRQDEAQVLSYDLTEAAVATVHVAPQSALRVPPGIPPASLIRDVTLDDTPSVMDVRAYSLPDADWSGVAAVEVDLRGGDEMLTLALSPTTTELTARMAPGPIEFRVRVLAEAEPDALGTIAPPEGGFRELRTRSLLIDPAVLAGRRVVSIVLGVVDPALVSQVHGRLVAGDQSREFLLGGERVECRIPVWGGGPLRLHAEFATADEGVLALDQVIGGDQSIVLLNQPVHHYQVVTVMFHDPLERYDSILVELESSGGEGRRGVAVSAALPTARWSARRGVDAPRTFRYRSRTIGRDARIIERDWQEGAGSLLVVGDVDVRVESIEGVLAGAGDALGALIRLTALDPPPDVTPTAEVVVDAGQSTFRARLPFRASASRRYRVEGEIFEEAGQRVIPPFEDGGEVLIVAAGPEVR
jgi:hypothetical protein